MKKTKITGLKAYLKEVNKTLMDTWTKEQTARLIEYAEGEIQSIGNDISVANTRNNLDRTGNLLDSLCWGLWYNGKRKGSGYYRSETAIEDSHLHEFSKPMGEAVNGHRRAQDFLKTYKPVHENGWELFFAVLAPYWGYWETGFSKPFGYEFKWQVMTHHYDIIGKDLAPAKVTFNVYRP